MHDPEVQSALNYLKTGGLGEVVGFTELAMNSGEPKVQSDTTMVMALCVLAGEALQKKVKTSSSDMSTKAARLMAMDDDEMRREAIMTVDPQEAAAAGDPLGDEPRLTPEFCQLVRSIAASVVSQDETKGQ